MIRDSGEKLESRKRGAYRSSGRKMNRFEYSLLNNVLSIVSFLNRYSELSCHRHRVKYISVSTNNSISLPFFFFYLFISLLGEIRSTRVPALAVGYTVGNYIATTKTITWASCVRRREIKVEGKGNERA